MILPLLNSVEGLKFTPFCHQLSVPKSLSVQFDWCNLIAARRLRADHPTESTIYNCANERESHVLGNSASGAPITADIAEKRAYAGRAEGNRKVDALEIRLRLKEMPIGFCE
jgi:hypothetical protein